MYPNFFKIDRKIFASNIWSMVLEFRLFFYLIGQARFKKEPVQKGNVEIKQGQFLRSYRNLQKDLEYVENNAVKQYSLSKIKSAIDNLVHENMIKVEKTQLGTLFTVLNYGKYQGKDRYITGDLERSENAERTQREQSLNNTKNDKNVKNDKNEKHSINNIVPKAEIEEIYSSLSDYYKDLFKRYIDLYRRKNTSGKITENRHYHLLSDIYQILQDKKFAFNGRQYDLSEDIFREGLETIISKGVDNLNYTKKVWISRLERRDKKQTENTFQSSEKSFEEIATNEDDIMAWIKEIGYYDESPQ
jgi:hypothetical protein